MGFDLQQETIQLGQQPDAAVLGNVFDCLGGKLQIKGA
jgi:hypothetical protein